MAISFIIIEAVQVRIAGEKQGRELQLDILVGVDTVHWYINTEIKGFSANTSAKSKAGLSWIAAARRDFSGMSPWRRPTLFTPLHLLFFKRQRPSFILGNRWSSFLSRSNFCHLRRKVGSFSIRLWCRLAPCQLHFSLSGLFKQTAGWRLWRLLRAGCHSKDLLGWRRE